MKAGLCTIALREKLLEDVLNVATDIGFDGVEIWGREPHISETFDEGRVRAARRMVRSRGMEVSMFGSYLRFGAAPPPDGQQNVTAEDALQTAQTLGTGLCRVWAGEMGSRQADRAYWKRVVDEMRAASEMAANLDLILAVEMHDNTLADTGKSTLRLIQDVGAPNVKANYQATFQKGGDDPYTRLRTVLPHVVSVHAQNYAEMAGNPGHKMRRVPLEDGVVEYRRIAKLLFDGGFDGYISIEFPPMGIRSKMRALSRDHRFLRSVVESLR